MTASPGFTETPRFTEPQAPTRPRRLYRSPTNRVFAGVCAGVADHFGADPTAVRLLTVVVALFTAVIPMFVLYLVAAIVIPERVGGEAPAGATRTPSIAWSGQGRLVLGAVLVLAGALALANELFLVEWDLLWPIALIVMGGGLVFAAQRR